MELCRYSLIASPQPSSASTSPSPSSHNSYLPSIMLNTNAHNLVKFPFSEGHGGGAQSMETTLFVASADGDEKELEKPDKKEKKAKKPRFAFQTRSQVDILDDGYRWRKYGQKQVKNNKFPRSYYKCTHHGCNVKKQVQRLAKDEGVVVTTYDGVHSHPIQKSNDNFEHILNQLRIYHNSASDLIS